MNCWRTGTIGFGKTDNEYDGQYGYPFEKIISAFESKEVQKDITILENEREDTESAHNDMYMEMIDAELGDADGMGMDYELEGDTSNGFLDELDNCFDRVNGKVIDTYGDEGWRYGWYSHSQVYPCPEPFAGVRQDWKGNLVMKKLQRFMITMKLWD